MPRQTIRNKRSILQKNAKSKKVPCDYCGSLHLFRELIKVTPSKLDFTRICTRCHLIQIRRQVLEEQKRENEKNNRSNNNTN